VTSHRPSRAPRSLARALALSPAAVVLVLASPASAARPDQWPAAEPVSPLSFLLVLVIFPVALFLVITLLSSIGAFVRSEPGSYQPGLAWRNEPEWFGGPHEGLAKVDRQPQVTTGGDAPDRGGASGRW
jgi:hypothetical protein